MAMHGYARRLLQESAAACSPSPSPSPHAHGTQRSASDDNTTTPSQSDPAAFDVNSHFTPSIIVMLVILLSAFFFMAFFAVYVRRCASDDDFLPRTDNSRRGRRDGPAAQPGVDPVLVGSFPLVSYAAVKKKGCNECSVCLTDFEGSENLRQLPKCKHVFHPGCIDMWLESHTTCPLCRRSLVNSDRWSVSLRWGSSRGSSVSAHLNDDGSVRSLGGESQTPRGGEGEVSPSGAHDAGCVFSELADREVTGTPSTPRDNNEQLPPPPQGWRRRLRRSNSTGHSLLKGTLTRAAFLASADDGSGTPAYDSRLSLSPLSLHRSRSVRLDGGEGQEQVAPAASSEESPSGGGGGGGGGGDGGWSPFGGGGWWNPSLKRALIRLHQHEPPP